MNHKEVSMERYYYIGLDIHKRIIAYCIKAIDGCLIDQGKIGADRQSLEEWVKDLPGPWIGAMEAIPISIGIHRLDIRFSQTTRHRPQGGSSCDAQGHNSRKEEE